MTIRVNAEYEPVIQRALKAGLIQSAQEVVDVGLEAIQKRPESQGGPADSMSAEQWLQEFRAWVESHPTTTPLLSDEAVSRESIYGTRGQ